MFNQNTAVAVLSGATWTGKPPYERLKRTWLYKAMQQDIIKTAVLFLTLSLLSILIFWILVVAFFTWRNQNYDPVSESWSWLSSYLTILAIASVGAVLHIVENLLGLAIGFFSTITRSPFCTYHCSACGRQILGKRFRDLLQKGYTLCRNVGCNRWIQLG